MTDEEQYQVGPWCFRHRERTLHHEKGHSVKLEDKVADLLLVLCQRPGAIVSRETLLEEVWDGRELSEQTIPVAISKLRKALGDDINRPTMLETVPRQGYRLLEPEADSGAQAPSFVGFRVATVMAALTLGLIAVVVWWYDAPAPGPRIGAANAEKPGIIVTINDVRPLDDTEENGAYAIAVSELASYFLSQIPDILVIRHWWNLDAPDPTGGIFTRYGAATPVYSLKGTLLDDPSGRLVTFILSDPKTDEIIWSGAHTIEDGSAGLMLQFDSMLSRLAVNDARLASAPEEGPRYWIARYFLQLSSESTAQIAAQQLARMPSETLESDRVQSMAQALVTRWEAELGEEGAALITGAVEAAPADPVADHLSLVDRASLTLYRDQDPVAALALLDQALTRAPGDHYALSLAGEAMAMQGDAEGALAAYRKAYRLAPYARAYEARIAELAPDEAADN